jgi:hypothetical protein
MGHARIVDSPRADVGSVPDTRFPRRAKKIWVLLPHLSPHLERRPYEAALPVFRSGRYGSQSTCSRKSAWPTGAALIEAAIYSAIEQAVPHRALEDCGPAAGWRQIAT